MASPLRCVLGFVLAIIVAPPSTAVTLDLLLRQPPGPDGVWLDLLKSIILSELFAAPMAFVLALLVGLPAIAILSSLNARGSLAYGLAGLGAGLGAIGLDTLRVQDTETLPVVVAFLVGGVASSLTFWLVAVDKRRSGHVATEPNAG